MNIKEIKELLQLIETASIEEFELERSGVRVRIRKAVSSRQPALSIAPSPTQTATEGLAQEAPEAAVSSSHHVFKAPMVGTFYRAPKPGADPFVEVKDQVSEGTMLCVIEAMKLFNQIESDVSGEIVRILAEDGQPVEYGEPLFEIELSA